MSSQTGKKKKQNPVNLLVCVICNYKITVDSRFQFPAILIRVHGNSGRSAQAPPLLLFSNHRGQGS